MERGRITTLQSPTTRGRAVKVHPVSKPRTVVTDQHAAANNRNDGSHQGRYPSARIRAASSAVRLAAVHHTTNELSRVLTHQFFPPTVLTHMSRCAPSADTTARGPRRAAGLSPLAYVLQVGPSRADPPVTPPMVNRSAAGHR